MGCSRALGLRESESRYSQDGTSPNPNDTSLRVPNAAVRQTVPQPSRHGTYPPLHGTNTKRNSFRLRHGIFKIARQMHQEGKGTFGSRAVGGCRYVQCSKWVSPQVSVQPRYWLFKIPLSSLSCPSACLTDTRSNMARRYVIPCSLTTSLSSHTTSHDILSFPPLSPASPRLPLPQTCLYPQPYVVD